MNPKQLTALRFAADAIVATPSDWSGALEFAEKNWKDPLVLEALSSIREAMNAQPDEAPRRKLVRASSTLLGDRDPSHQDAGAALFSAILSRGWPEARLIVSETTTGRLAAMYTRAACETQ